MEIGLTMLLDYIRLRVSVGKDRFDVHGHLLRPIILIDIRSGVAEWLTPRRDTDTAVWRCEHLQTSQRFLKTKYSSELILL